MSGWDLGKEVQTFAVLLSGAVEPDVKGSGVLSGAVAHLLSLGQSTAASSIESNQGRSGWIQTTVFFRNKKEIKTENTSHQDCITSMTQSLTEQSTGDNQHHLARGKPCPFTYSYIQSQPPGNKEWCSYLLYKGQCSSHTPKSVFIGIFDSGAAALQSSCFWCSM